MIYGLIVASASAKGSPLWIKASAGIPTLEQALSLIDVGAHRLGASASVLILEGLKGDPADNKHAYQIKPLHKIARGRLSPVSL